MSRSRAALLLCLVSLQAAPAHGAAGKLSARIWPAIASAPAAVRIEILIQPDDDNRFLQIAVDSGAYFRASTIALEGAKAARFHAVQYRSMPVGDYDVVVELIGPGGITRALDRQLLRIIP
jgi:hypothetical protein